MHHIEVQSDFVRLRVEVENFPSDANPLPSKPAYLSAIATFVGIAAITTIGTYGVTGGVKGTRGDQGGAVAGEAGDAWVQGLPRGSLPTGSTFPPQMAPGGERYGQNACITFSFTKVSRDANEYPS